MGYALSDEFQASGLQRVETCQRRQISIRHYLSSILPGLAEFPAKRVSELTPGNWGCGRSWRGARADPWVAPTLPLFYRDQVRRRQDPGAPGWRSRSPEPTGQKFGRGAT